MLALGTALRFIAALAAGRELGSIPLTDGAVAPTPPEQYTRYVTFLATGTRTYTCDTASRNFTLRTFEYDLVDADATEPAALPLGKHTLLLRRDVDGGNSVFYTRVSAFTYWVGKVTRFAPNSGPPNPLDLPLEQDVRTESSEPRPLEAGKYDLGVATYVTRFGAKGGNVPPGTPCHTVAIASTCFYSFWKKVA